jgi:hypothetical protein
MLINKHNLQMSYLCSKCNGANPTCSLCKNDLYQQMIRENLGGRPRCTRGGMNARFCKGGGKCDACREIEGRCSQGSPWWNTDYKCCKNEGCRRCIACEINLHMHKILTPSGKTGGCITDYCKVSISNTLSGTIKKVYMHRDPDSRATYYDNALPLTKAVICDYLDRYGLLFESQVTQPSGYVRMLRYKARDTPVQRVGKHSPGHKQEVITCPIKMCDDRTGRCNCQCDICKGYIKECKCCKVCCNKEDECTCCKVCGNKEDECTCSVLKFLSLWSL